uniref:Predicted protein n=1 Tax=Hordeum vulgare subsp. vulgare TaxID=112509 RepID=F2D565_HORVV|nr:predicted protein [Hordeum vulgare subsp. vulgare]
MLSPIFSTIFFTTFSSMLCMSCGSISAKLISHFTIVSLYMSRMLPSPSFILEGKISTVNSNFRAP